MNAKFVNLRERKCFAAIRPMATLSHSMRGRCEIGCSGAENGLCGSRMIFGAGLSAIFFASCSDGTRAMMPSPFQPSESLWSDIPPDMYSRIHGPCILA